VASKKKTTVANVKPVKAVAAKVAARPKAAGKASAPMKAAPVAEKKRLATRPAAASPKKAVAPPSKSAARDQNRTPINVIAPKPAPKVATGKGVPPPRSTSKPNVPVIEAPKPKAKPGKGLNDQQRERMKGLLLDRRKEILGRKTNTEAAAEELADSGGDSADRAAVSVDRDFMAESQARDAKSLKDIDEALVKLESGTYGICEECGSTIGLKRLEYLPNVAYCIDCQEKFEEQGLYPEPASGNEDFRLVE
jgi:DnaK suppressor protein